MDNWYMRTSKYTAENLERFSPEVTGKDRSEISQTSAGVCGSDGNKTKMLRPRPRSRPKL